MDMLKSSFTLPSLSVILNEKIPLLFPKVRSLSVGLLLFSSKTNSSCFSVNLNSRLIKVFPLPLFANTPIFNELDLISLVKFSIGAMFWHLIMVVILSSAIFYGCVFLSLVHNNIINALSKKYRKRQLRIYLFLYLLSQFIPILSSEFPCSPLQKLGWAEGKD